MAQRTCNLAPTNNQTPCSPLPLPNSCRAQTNLSLPALTKVTKLTCNNSGLGELISTTFAAEGANIAINYFNRHAPAEAVQKACLAQGVKAVTIQAVRS